VKAQLQGLASGSAIGGKPEVLEALAVQMDASGQTAVAQALRAKAQQLRVGGAAGATSAIGSSATASPSSMAPPPSPAPTAQ
jgi:hypothetical protein